MNYKIDIPDELLPLFLDECAETGLTLEELVPMTLKRYLESTSDSD